MRITQSTSVGGLNPDWFIDCEAREMAGSAWSVEETRALLNLWGDDRVQRQLEGAVRNKAVFETIQRALANLGYQRTWIQCRVKVKNLIATYRKIKDNNNRSGQGRSDFLFFNLLDRILGTRPASRPTNILSSCPAPPTTTQPNPNPPAQDSEPAQEEDGRHQTAEDDEVEEDEDREDQGSSPHGQNEDESNDGGEAQEEETVNDSGISPARTATLTASTNTPSNSGIRRKRTEADRRISEVLVQLERQTQESDRRFFEFEEKRMKTEAVNEERRAAREEDRMMRMQQMFMQQMQQMMMMFTSYGPPSFPYPPVSIATSLGQPSTPVPTPRQGQPSQPSDDSP